MTNFPADMLLQFGNKKISIDEKPADGGAGRTAFVPQTPEALARQKFLTKALRTLTSEGPAGELARVVCKITRRKVIDRVDNMTADEFASAQRMVNKGLPALAASGLLRCVDLSENLSPEGPVVDWTSAEAFDSWVEAAHAKFKQAKGAAVNGPRNVVVHEGTAALPGSYLQLRAVIREDLSCTLACKTEEELSQFGLTAAERSAYVSPDSIWLLNRKGSSNVFKLVVKVATKTDRAAAVLKSYVGFVQSNGGKRTDIIWSAALAALEAYEFVCLLQVPPSGQPEVATKAVTIVTPAVGVKRAPGSHDLGALGTSSSAAPSASAFRNKDSVARRARGGASNKKK